ncbi:hypothetical protein ACS0TY_014412 [Phlomoides rotata]
MISADGIPFHKTCFKCDHCSGRLAMSNYSAVDGKLYCKPHFEQLFKETGSFTTKKFQSRKSSKPILILNNRTPSKVSTLFSGTQEKCAVCTKTVYPLEKVTVEGDFFHKSCFRCAHGGCNLTPSNYAALDGTIYCKPHFAQLFKEKGSYSTLNKTNSLKKQASPLEPADTTKSDDVVDDEQQPSEDAPAAELAQET